MPPFHLPYREWRRLYRRAYAAQQRNQWEVSGVFGADRQRRIFLIFVENESNRAGHFEFGERPFSLARKAVRTAGGRVLGIFHSHPISEPVMGSGDIRNSSANSMHLIYDVCGVNARLWRVLKIKDRKKPVEVPLIIERNSKRRLKPPLPLNTPNSR